MEVDPTNDAGHAGADGKLREAVEAYVRAPDWDTRRPRPPAAYDLYWLAKHGHVDPRNIRAILVIRNLVEDPRSVLHPTEL